MGCPEVRPILDSIRRLTRSMRESSRAAERDVGLSGAQLAVLHTLAGGGAMCLNDLAGHTRTHQSSVSVVVTRLVERGLIVRQRSDSDGRRLELTLTDEATALLQKAPAGADVRLVAALNRMSTPRRRTLAHLLSLVAQDVADLGEAPSAAAAAEDAPPTSRPVRRPRAASTARRPASR
ncbi:MAG: Transcriptional regulator, MarR family [uncultured Phycisphaerae bacterium]|uniref:Transcriptional regulator, MarR family n=1 Tax=uncultured Phycisphaerae bacterium TaxID=904963 RepID=A0A6J4P0T9_9BACT|nr:MAG: Transcriptional regulator, MarR family [uncultured Phycisphaerae bacterium]